MINEERLVKTFCDLVQIDSPSDEEEEVAQDLSRRLEALGFEILRDAHGNLIAREDGDNPLLLSAHMDTVEPGRGIKPTIEGDRIVSDGTTILGGDCKAGVAAILEGLESVVEEELPRRTIQLAFTRGEEIGLVGARNMDFSMITADEAVVFDGNGPVNKLTGSSPTYVSFEVNITGRSAHAGVEPEKGSRRSRLRRRSSASFPKEGSMKRRPSTSGPYPAAVSGTRCPSKLPSRVNSAAATWKPWTCYNSRLGAFSIRCGTGTRKRLSRTVST